MLLVVLLNILGHDNRGDRPTEVLLMTAYGERGVLERPNMRVMRSRNGALSGSDLANEPGLGSSRTYQPGEMPLPSKPRPGLRRMHQDMNSETASSSSQLKAAVPPKRARVEEEVQTNETMQDLNGTIVELEKTRRELMMLSVEEDREMQKKLYEDDDAGVDDGSGKSDTCKKCSLWAVPDGAPNASQTKSDNGGATPNYERVSNNPRPK